MFFIALLILSTLGIAGSAAFFSVIGLAKVFTGAFWSVIFMGTSLESGKLITASYLYRFWTKMSKLMRGYLIGAVVILMTITSMGIFGYLSSAYQSNTMTYDQQNQQIVLLEQDKTQTESLKAERVAREDQINKQIADLPDNYVNGRNRLMRANKDELDQIRKDVAGYTSQILIDSQKIAALKQQSLVETAHVGPIIFIAEAFHLPASDATKWLIFLIMSVFDPLAVVLTIATNLAIVDYSKQPKKVKPVPLALPVESSLPTQPEVIKLAEPDPTPVEEPNPVNTEVIEQPAPPKNEFVAALEALDRDNLTQHEKSVKKTIEETIKRYTGLISR